MNVTVESCKLGQLRGGGQLHVNTGLSENCVKNN